MGAASAETTLTVYTALEADQIKAYQAAFEKANPDIKIQWVRDSTGIITAKLLAEKNNPKADAIWGLAGTSLGLMDKEGMLQPYAPRAWTRSPPTCVTPRPSPPGSAWTASPPPSASTPSRPKAEAAQAHVVAGPDQARVRRQDRHAEPGLVGHRLPGRQRLAADLRRREGWAYMDALHKNIGSYTHSGSKPCNLAASGEFPIGVSFDYRAAKLKADGAPVEAVFPSEGLGWEVEATAIVKGTKNLEAARKLADFSASREANELYKANFAVLAIPSIATSSEPAGRSDQAHDQERLHLGRHQPRSHHRRVDPPLRRQVRAEEEVSRPLFIQPRFSTSDSAHAPSPMLAIGIARGAARSRLCRSVAAPLKRVALRGSSHEF